MTDVSIIVPNYNYARYLPTCLSAALNQRGVDVRICVIDNCSTDGSQELLRRFAAHEKRVELILHEQNQGLIGSLSEGVRWATAAGSALTMTLSADDVLAPGALERAATVFHAAPTVGLVYGRTARLPGDARPGWSDDRFCGYDVIAGRDWIHEVCASGRNPLFDPEVVVRTSVYAEIGSYNPRLPHTSDMEMWLRCAARMDVGRLRGAEQAFYREHPHQLSQSFWSGRVGDLQGRQDAFDEFFRQDGHLVRDAAGLQALAHRALSVDALRLANRAYDRGETEQVSVDDLLAFVDACDRSARRSLPALGLRVRRAIGPRASRLLRVREVTRIPASVRARFDWRQRQVRSALSASSWPPALEL